jgi:hypothetical protein
LSRVIENHTLLALGKGFGRTAMEEAHHTHKEVSIGWFAWLQAFLARKALERRERSMAIWGDGADVGAWEARPDALYRRVRAAWDGGQPAPHAKPAGLRR